MAVTFVAVGANLNGPYGSPREAVLAAISMIRSNNINLLDSSRLYRSPAWPNPADPEFVNAVVQVETRLTPADLLAALHAIERRFGRTRGVPNTPRTMDLDIVDYDGRVSAAGETPILPHPRMGARAFVLLPLAELAPDWRHPVTGQPIAALIRALPDLSGAEPITP